MQLPAGILIESRKGSSDVLSTMASDFATLSTSGYLKTERKTSSGLVKIGHLVFAKGEPIAAIHEANGITQGVDALLEIEADSVIIDCDLSAVELSEEVTSEIRRLYKSATLFLEDGIAQAEDNWWMDSKIDSTSWSRPERLPEFENIISAPEEIQQFTRAMLASSNIEISLDSGTALLVDEEKPDLLFELTSLIAQNGKSIFSMARQPTNILVEDYKIPSTNCLRFTESPGPGNIVASLENINRKFDELLWESERSVISLEGIEYLASLYGENRVLDLLRTMIDKVRNEDHLLLIGCNLSAFDTTFRATIATEIDLVENKTIRNWLEIGELLVEQPLFQTLDEAESLWIEAELNSALEDNKNDSVYSTDIIHGGSQKLEAEVANEVGKDLTSMMKEWAAESRVDSSNDNNSYNPEVPPSPDWKPNFESIEKNDVHEHYSSLEENKKGQSSKKRQFVNKFVPLPTRKGMRKAVVVKRKRRPRTADTSSTAFERNELSSAASKNVRIPSLSQQKKVENRQHFAVNKENIESSKILKSEVYSLPANNIIAQAGKQINKTRATEFGTMELKKPLDVVNKIAKNKVDYIPLDSGQKRASKYSRSQSSKTQSKDALKNSQNNWNSMNQPSKHRGDSIE